VVGNQKNAEKNAEMKVKQSQNKQKKMRRSQQKLGAGFVVYLSE